MKDEKLKKVEEQMKEKENEDLNDFSVVSKIASFVGFDVEKSVDDTNNTEITYVLKFDYFTISPEIKKEILAAMSSAFSENMHPPYIILLPRSRIKEKVDLSDFTYPLKFLDSYVYIVPYIRKILVYEND